MYQKLNINKQRLNALGSYIENAFSYLQYLLCMHCLGRGAMRLVLLMRRRGVLCMAIAVDVASFLADFCVVYGFASLEYLECTGILITLLMTCSSGAGIR
jgi:hypothetical protein